MADSVMKRQPVLLTWDYETGLMLRAISLVWLKTDERKYYDYIEANYDRWVNEDGSINKYYVFDEYQLDHIAPGKLLFMLHQTTGKAKYEKAIRLLRAQLETQPRTSEGGFWHKKIHPYQMWVDGVFMAAPFYAEYARTYDELAGFDDVAKQIILMTKHTRDPKTGLFYHGWDESKAEVWADPVDGHSPHFWGRGLGWFTMGVVDVLDFMPEDHPQHPAIVEIFQNMMASIAQGQDAAGGVWYQVLDRAGQEGNYLEASGSCMFVYSTAKGVRKGYLGARFMDVARRGYAGILKNFITVDEQGLVDLNRICRVAAFDNGSDGSYRYYINQPVVSNDFKGVGPFILASVEMER
jgi:unsaturated rhamnogalacturonyl hydrolase